MKINGDRLAGELGRRLLPVYVISGDEPLLCAEAADAVRARARAAGCSERQVYFIERGEGVWNQAVRDADSMSLFASQRLLEIRLGSGRQEKAGEYLPRLIAAAGDDLVLLVSMPRIADKDAPAWLQAAAERGVWVSVWPLRPAEFPDWLRRRAQAAGLQLREDAIRMLVERTEGNLLAAHQELDKLRMQLGPGATVDAATVAISSSDSARFSARQIVDAVLEGDAARALRVTASLRAEGEDAVLILWALQTARVRLTSEAKDPRQRTAALRLALRAWRAERMLKGRLHGVAWDEIALLTAELCGKRPLPLQRWQLRAT